MNRPAAYKVLATPVQGAAPLPAPVIANVLIAHLEDALRRVNAHLQSPEGSALFSVAGHNFALDVRQDLLYAIATAKDLPR